MRVTKVGEGKLSDVIDDTIDLRCRHFHFGSQPADHGLGKRIEQNLSDDAVGAEARLFVIGRQAQHVADQVAQPSVAELLLCAAVSLWLTIA